MSDPHPMSERLRYELDIMSGIAAKNHKLEEAAAELDRLKAENERLAQRSAEKSGLIRDLTTVLEKRNAELADIARAALAGGTDGR